MSKLPQISGKDVVKVLLKIGFKMVSQKGSHAKLVRKTNDQNQSVIIPMHKVLKKGTLRNGILKPINLNVDQFIEILKNN